MSDDELDALADAPVDGCPAVVREETKSKNTTRKENDVGLCFVVLCVLLFDVLQLASRKNTLNNICIPCYAIKMHEQFSVSNFELI